MVNRRRNKSQLSAGSGLVHDPAESTIGIKETMPQRQHQDIMLDIIARLRGNADYSDVKIICRDKILPAHKLVLCPRSKYFQSACGGIFKESQGSITLDTRNPALVEKMLEFLYTGSYTVKGSTAEVEISPSDSDVAPRSDTLNSEGTREQFDIIDCHPCYFHLRMYGEADYFMIEDLKIRAEENFRNSFEDCFEKEILALTIKELYSARADYRDIRKLAIKLLVGNLRELQGGLTPVIDSDLLRAFPEFSTEFCLATMEEFLSESLGPKQPVIPFIEYNPFKYKRSEYQWGK